MTKTYGSRCFSGCPLSFVFYNLLLLNATILLRNYHRPRNLLCINLTDRDPPALPHWSAGRSNRQRFLIVAEVEARKLSCLPMIALSAFLSSSSKLSTAVPSEDFTSTVKVSSP